MALELNTRRVGSVAVVRCSGRMVAGPESDSVRRHISGLLALDKHVVLHLGEVRFMDSSGLGTMVRLLADARRAGGDIKLCQVRPEVSTVLKVTNLAQLFQMYEQEEEAITAFYRQPEGAQPAAQKGARLLCVDESADVLACLREVLAHAGFEVLSTDSLPDALTLLRVTRPALVVLGANLKAAAGTRQAFQQACARLPVVELGQAFATLEASEAAAELLKKIQGKLAS